MEDEMKKGIDDMLKGLSGELSVEEIPEEIPKEEPSKDLPSKEGSPIEEPLEEEPPKEELDEKDKLINELREKLALKEKEILEKEELPPKEEIPKEEPLTLEAQDFVGDLDFDDIIHDRDEFNKILNTVYSKGINEARKVVGEGILLGIPDIVRANIEIVTKLKETSEKFYKDNPDLSPFKKVVAAVFEEVASQNPGKKYGEILEEVGPETRKRLDLHKKTVEDDNKGNPPRLPTKKGGSGDKHEKPNISPLQAELDEMNKALRR